MERFAASHSPTVAPVPDHRFERICPISEGNVIIAIAKIIGTIPA
jgi:hypothetical protein